jgi:hypothetical protein
MKEKKENGLGFIETGSQSYLSGLLGFDEYEKEDYDNNTEDDLRALGIESGDYEQEIDLFLRQESAHSDFWVMISKLDQTAKKYIQDLFDQK